MVQMQTEQWPCRWGKRVIPRRMLSGALPLAVACVALMAISSVPAQANTLCVSPGGWGGCFSSIQKAIDAAAPYDTIRVRAGEYDEGVIISKPLSLIGEDEDNTIIDARGKPNGINIDGIDGSDHIVPQNIVVRDFTIKNADFEGILVTNAWYVSILDVSVVHNDRKLDASTATCPGLPAFETAEGFDCGEGIHFSGVAYSIVSKSKVVKNAGGILLSDDTGSTHDNLIANNYVADNPYDCGITLASHPPAMLTQSTTPLGVFNNTIFGNTSTRNGLAIEGAGAGVGIFDSVPGTRNSENVVIGNELTDNGLPGVALHSHAPGQNLDNNMIIGNYIAGNGKDTEDAATPGPTGINVFAVSPAYGVIIAQNTIRHEHDAVATNTAAQVTVHLNNLLAKTGVDNIGTGNVDATENWWGCRGGPTDGECSNVEGANVLFKPWLYRPFHVEQNHEDHEADHKDHH